MFILKSEASKPFWFFITINFLPLIFRSNHLLVNSFESGYNSYDNVHYRRTDNVVKENVTKTNEHDFRSFADNILEGVLQSIGCFWTEKVAGTAAEHISSHGVNKFATEKISRECVKKTVGHTMERSVDKLTWKSGKRAVEGTVSNVIQNTIHNPGKHMIEKNSGKITRNIFKQEEHILLQKTGKELARKAAEGGVTSKIIERTGERYLEQKSIPKIFLSKGECLFNTMSPIPKTKNSVLSLMSQTKREACYSAKKLRFGQHGRAKEGLMKTTMGRRIVLKIQSLSQRRVFGRVLLMTIPILGGIFSLHLFRCDIVRIIEEQLKRKKYNTNGNLILYLTTMLTFYCVAMADLLDTACHFALSYFFLLSSSTIRPKIILLEKFSFTCAIVSTACSIFGELTSFISSAQTQDQVIKQKTSDESTKT